MAFLERRPNFCAPFPPATEPPRVLGVPFSETSHIENDLARKAKAGDTESTEKLFDFFYPRIYLFTFLRLGNPDIAEDVTQDVMLKVLTNLEKHQDRGLPFGAWVFKITRNEVISYVKKAKARKGEVPFNEIFNARYPHEISAEDEISDPVEAQRLRTAIKGLSAAQRAVIEHRFLEDHSVEYTARALGKTQNNVKALQHKGVAALKRKLRPPATNY